MAKEANQNKSSKTSSSQKSSNSSLVGKLAAIIKGKRVVVFIDGSNLYYTLQSINKKFDYSKFEQWLNKHATLKGIHYYAAFDPEDQKQIDFLNDLNGLGYTTHQKPIRWVIDHYKGNMDVELAVDAMYYMNIYDVMILISGDGDFSYLCQTLEKVKRTTVILSMGGYTAQELHESATNYFFLERIKSIWEYRPGRKIKQLTRAEDPELKEVAANVSSRTKLKVSNSEDSAAPIIHID
ncbi:MAG: hypothetical protein OHK0017_13670 [Patescibacteria group bacterium]